MFRIIALSDFSVNAHHALLVAMRMAQSYSGEVILTYAMEKAAIPATAPSSVFTELLSDNEKMFLEKLRVQVQNAFQELNIRHREVMYQTKVVTTPLEESVAELSEQLEVSLIVMGNSGATGLSRIIAGSNTLRMVKGLPKPLLVIPHGFTFKGFSDITLLIRPYHYKPRAGTDLLFRFARTYSAKLNFVFVVEDEKEAPALSEFLNVHDQLREAEAFSPSTYIVSTSDNSDALVEHVRNSGANLLVTFPRSKNIWEDLFSQSITEEIANRSDKPLLVLPKLDLLDPKQPMAR